MDYSVAEERVAKKRPIYGLDDARSLFLADFEDFWREVTVGPEGVNINAQRLG